MSQTSGDPIDPEYITGLLDSLARVRFDLSEHADDTFTVRPELRIRPYQTQLRKAILGEFLESQDVAYEFVDRDRGHSFFRLNLRSDLETISEYVNDHSKQLVHELSFATGPHFERYDTDILEPQDAYEFLLTREQLRYGWNPRGPRLTRPKDIAEEYEVDTENATPGSLPDTAFAPGYSTRYIAGVFDGICRYRPSIAENDDYDLGYSFFLTARLRRAGVSGAFIETLRTFCADYDLDVGDSSDANTVLLVFTGTSSIRRVMEVLIDDLFVLYDSTAYLLENILPLYDAEVHREKQGFYNLVHDFEQAVQQSGPRERDTTFTSPYFAELWSDDITTADEAPHQSQRPPDESGPTSLTDFDHPETVTVPKTAYEDDIGRYQSIPDRVHRDGELAFGLRRMYKNRCQLCGQRRAKADGAGYAEVHHIQPLGDTHDGVDALENMLVLCPNHHADFDNGVVWIDPDTLLVTHPYDDVDGERVDVVDGDSIGAEYLEYHRQHIAQQAPSK